MAIKIYGNRQSNSTMKVLYAAELLKEPYTFKHMDWQKDLKTPAYLKIHPAGKIPAITDGTFTLWESNTILRYLAGKHGKLYPQALKQRAIVDQWLDFASIHVGSAVSKVAWNRAWAPMMGLPVDEKAITDGLSMLDRILPILDAQLGKAPFIAGKTMTIADISLFAALEYAEPSKIDISKYKRLTKWFSGLQKQAWVTRARAEK